MFSSPFFSFFLICDCLEGIKNPQKKDAKKGENSAGPTEKEKKEFLEGFSTEAKDKRFKQDGTDDYKILGSEKLKASKFVKDAEITEKDIGEAYDKRLQIINEQEEEKQPKMETAIEMARKRLIDAFNARNEANRINKIHDDKQDESQKHLNIMEVTTAKLGNGDYDEYSFYSEYQKRRRQLDLDNIVEMAQNAEGEDQEPLNELRDKVRMALRYLNGAYNELVRALLIKTINNANGMEADEKVLGFGTMDELLEAIKDEQKLSDTYNKRRSIIYAEINFLKEGEDSKNDKKVEDAEKALQKLKETYDRVSERGTQYGTERRGRESRRQFESLPPILPKRQPMNKPGDMAMDCGLRVHQCVGDFEKSMNTYCHTTCNELGVDGEDVGLNCPYMADRGHCEDDDFRANMDKFCRGTCTRRRVQMMGMEGGGEE